MTDDDGDPPGVPEMIGHALLVTVAMWTGKVPNKEAVRLTEMYYKFEDVYEANVLLCEKMKPEMQKSSFGRCQKKHAANVDRKPQHLDGKNRVFLCVLQSFGDVKSF